MEVISSKTQRVSSMGVCSRAGVTALYLNTALGARATRSTLGGDCVTVLQSVPGNCDRMSVKGARLGISIEARAVGFHLGAAFDAKARKWT